MDKFDVASASFKKVLKSAADSIDVVYEELLEARTPRARKALLSSIMICRVQLEKMGIELNDAEAAGCAGVPVDCLRKDRLSRKEMILAMKQAGYSLAEVASTVRMPTAAVLRSINGDG